MARGNEGDGESIPGGGTVYAKEKKCRSIRCV